jgi:hypothetical protein
VRCTEANKSAYRSSPVQVGCTIQTGLDINVDAMAARRLLDLSASRCRVAEDGGQQHAEDAVPCAVEPALGRCSRLRSCSKRPQRTRAAVRIWPSPLLATRGHGWHRGSRSGEAPLREVEHSL